MVAAPVKTVLRTCGVRRHRVAATRAWLERNALPFVEHGEGLRSRVLCYHSVGTPRWGINDVSPAQFRRHIELALDLGFHFVPASVITTGSTEPRLAVTFDDGVASVATTAAPMLRDYGIPFTVFVVTGWSDGDPRFADGSVLDWKQLEALADAGAAIGSHSVTHANPRYLAPDQLEYELAGSRAVIRDRLGLDATAFAIPMGTSRDWSPAAQQLACQAGYRAVYAQSEERRAPGTIARTFVTKYDNDRIFRAALHGAFDRWEEWA
ncbi:MAG: polysaccharide deacetylase family protein [Dehalococcoidia bacterium]|nr:polysaccharide deacetylase family protein [Dehalococcoidia bacterium]